MASSIKLMRLENLIEGTGEDGGGTAGDIILRLTDAGRDGLNKLLNACRACGSE